jgi:hypothetical protein
METTKPYAYLFNNKDLSDAELEVFTSNVDDGVKKMKMSPIVTYPVHTLILASHAEYFNSAIRRWSSLDVDGVKKLRVEIPQSIPLQTFELFLQSFYTEKIELDEADSSFANRLLDILILSEMFQAKYSGTAALAMLKGEVIWQLDLDHVTSIFDLSLQVQKDEELMECYLSSLRDLYYGDRMLSDRCSIELEHFLLLPVQAVEAVIMSTIFDDMFYWDSENTVLLMLAMWMKKNYESCSTTEIIQLSSLIRVQELSETYKTQMIPLMKWYNAPQQCIRACDVEPSPTLQLTFGLTSTDRSRIIGAITSTNIVMYQSASVFEKYFGGHYWSKFNFIFKENARVFFKFGEVSTKMQFPTEFQHLDENFNILPTHCTIEVWFYGEHNGSVYSYESTVRANVSQESFMFVVNSVKDMLSHVTEMYVTLSDVV